MPQVDITLISFFMLFVLFVYLFLFIFFIVLSIPILNSIKFTLNYLLFSVQLGEICAIKINFISYFIFVRNLHL